MSVGRTGIWKTSWAALAVAALCLWLVSGIRSSGPYTIDAAELSGWTLVEGKSGEPGMVALQPPRHFSEALLEDLVSRTGLPLVAPGRTLMPLVLRTEYDDSLQGVLSSDDVMRLARDAGVAAARFEPVCVGRRSPVKRGETGSLFFVVFESAAFSDFRQRLLPMHTEHGGASVYDPSALRPILSIASTDRALASWWPDAVERWDCQFPLEVTTASRD